MRIILSTAGVAALALTAAAFDAPAAPAGQQQRCHPSYPDYCIAPPPPDLDCPDITGRKPFRVRHDVRDPDPHGFDRDRDGRACEPRPPRRPN
jgi:micrococcal nuclease